MKGQNHAVACVCRDESKLINYKIAILLHFIAAKRKQLLHVRSIVGKFIL